MKRIILLIFLLAGILVTIWFREGDVMGTAEDSLLFQNVSYFLPESQFAWMEHPGLGRVTINLTAARPTYEILVFLQRLNVPNFLIQALTFWVILVIAGLGIYFTVKEFFPQLHNRYVLISVLFYWFNPLSLVNVWNRFLADYIFFFGLLPIASFIFIRGLKAKNYIWSFILILIFPFFGFTFTFIASVFLLWMMFLILSFLFYLTHKELNARLFYIKYFLLTFLFFVLTNSWWIGQLLSQSLYNNVNSSVINFNSSDNLGILDALSRKMGNLSDIFRLINASFLVDKPLEWIRIFHSLPFVLIEYLITGLILYSIIRNIKKKSVLILGGLFFISIYLAKGINPPFGEVYKFFFANIPYLQVFRNPFEKAGFILSISASLLVGFSLFSLSQQIPKKATKLIYFGLLSFIILVWGFPFYTGLVFTSPEPPTDNYKIGYKVKVPSYYQEADRWLISQGNNFRFIGFPLGDEGITYSWEKGYTGVELSTALFSTPGILHNTAIPYYHDLIPHIQETLLSQNNFLEIANILNVRFIFIRHDIDYERRKMENPSSIDESLTNNEKKNELKKVATFGKLTFWENLKWQDRTFYVAKTAVISSNNQQFSDLLPIDVNRGEVLIDNKDVSLELENSAELSYERINPTKYVVHIKNEAPFILVFSELFNDAWQASHQNEVYKHFRANFYANGWLIDEIGNFDIVIEYLPQKLLESGEKISMVSYFLIILITILLFLKRVKIKGN